MAIQKCKLPFLTLSIAMLVACGGSDSDSSGDNDSGTGGGTTQSFTVSTQVGDGGSISPTSKMIQIGNTTTFTLKPDDNFEIAEVKGCGGSLDGGTYTTGNVTSNCTVNASFDKKAFTVSTDFSHGGNLSPSQVTAEIGERVVLQVSTDEYYHLDSIKGCQGQLINGQYVVEALESNCEVTATFAEDYVQLTGTAPHITSEDELFISVDGFTQEEASLVAHDGIEFTVQIKVTGDNVSEDGRLRLRVNGSDESGSPLQYTATLPSIEELYSGERIYIDSHDNDSLRVTALTTVIDAYASSLLESEHFNTEKFEQALEVMGFEGLSNRLAVAEATFQNNLFGLPTHSSSLHQLLSSWSKINSFIQPLDSGQRQQFIDLALAKLADARRPLPDGELYAFETVFREAASSAYLSIVDNKLTYASTSSVGNNWFSPPLEFVREGGKLSVNQEPIQGSPEAAGQYCSISDTEIGGISNPQGISYQVACETRLNSVWNVLKLSDGHLLALQNERYIYEQELYIGDSLVKINAQTDYSTSLQKFSQLPATWDIGSSQIDARYDDLWVLPSIEHSGTNLFKLKGDHTYEEKVLFETELEGFDMYRSVFPDSFGESGVWMLENGATRLRLVLGDMRYAEIEKISDDNAMLRYLVTFRTDDGLVQSRRVLRLGRVSDFITPQEFLEQTQGRNRLSALNRGDSSLHYPSKRSGFFSWQFGESDGNTVGARCDSVNFFNDNCDGEFVLVEEYTFSVELLDDYMLTNRQMSGDSKLLRAFVVLEVEGNEMLIFEQGVWQVNYDFYDYPQYLTLIPGRLLKWGSIEIIH